MGTPVSDQEVKSEIDARLERLEAAEGVRVLFAVESGSRAWGFPSLDSDYDVRFVYIRRPEWYLSIDLERRRDVLEVPVDAGIDVSGWDIRKALSLFAKSNPPLLEWLGSPIVYREILGLAERLRRLLPVFYSPHASAYHYLHMAQGNFREYLRGETVWLKKYLYVLRPLLAVRWVEQARGVVPMEFSTLLVTINGQAPLLADIQQLVERKRAGEELDRGPAIASISEFIASELSRLESFRPPRPDETPGLEPLNLLFRELIHCAWSAP